MKRTLAIALALTLAACSQQKADQENADDFAARIGQASSGAANDPSQPTMDMPNVAQAAPPPGADVTQMQKLGDVAGVNLGPREGGCTFVTNGQEMIIAAGLKDPGASGKGVIRVGNGLVLLDAGPGGLAAVKRGTTFTGEGVTVKITPAKGEGQSRSALVTVGAPNGNSQNYVGNWICA